MSTAGGNKVQVAGSSELSTLLLVYDPELNGLGAAAPDLVAVLVPNDQVQQALDLLGSCDTIPKGADPADYGSFNTTKVARSYGWQVLAEFVVPELPACTEVDFMQVCYGN